MSIRDREISGRGLAGRILVNHPLAPTASKTKRPYLIASPGVPFQLKEAYIGCAAYTADLDIMLTLSGQDEIYITPALLVDAVPEKFKVGAAVYRVGGKFVEKAAETAIVFTAAHVVTALKHGIIAVQISNAGAVSTKVPAATPTTAMAYNTAAAALAALPAADAGKVRIGYILIEAGAANWDANTDDMTAASDLTAVTFVSEAVTALDALTGTISPVAMEKSAGTLHGTLSHIRDTNTSNVKDIVALATTDANIVLTNGVLHVGFFGIGSRT